MILKRLRSTYAGHKRAFTFLFWLLGPICLMSLLEMRASGDRIVLAPRGLITTPGAARIEFATLADNSRSNIAWINAGLPQQDLGLELEGEHFELGGQRRETFSLQYTLTGNAFSDFAPAFSVGLRDALNKGREGRSLFAAATKTLGLSLNQEHLIRDLKVHAGYGTSKLGGAYVGLTGRFTLGFTANVEYVAHRFNAEIAVPVARNLQIRGYSLNGDVFYGASLYIRH